MILQVICVFGVINLLIVPGFVAATWPEYKYLLWMYPAMAVAGLLYSGLKARI
jgi:hypothetical protein